MASAWNKFNLKRQEKSRKKQETKHRDEVYNYIYKNFNCFVPSDCIDEAELILNCENQEIINKAFYQVTNDDLKKFILLNLEDKKFLERIVFDSTVEGEFRERAMIKLDSQKVYEKIVVDKSNHCSLRNVAAKKLEGKEDKFWYDIIVSQGSNYSAEWLLDTSFSKIKSQQMIADVIKRDNISYLMPIVVVDEAHTHQEESDVSRQRIKPHEVAFSERQKYEFEEIKKKLYAVKFLVDQEILKDLLLNFELTYEVTVAIVEKLQKEEYLMEAFRKYKKDSEIVEVIVSRIEELNYTNSLLELVVDSEDKAFISRCIKKFTNENDLCMVVEKSKFWYSIALAEKRLKELGF